MTRSAHERIQDILQAIARCERYRERFGDSDDEVIEMAFHASIRQLAVIGEAVNHLPPTVTASRPGVPWADIVEMRNILIHEYFRVDTDLIVQTLDKDLAPLADALRTLSLDRRGIRRHPGAG